MYCRLFSSCLRKRQIIFERFLKTQSLQLKNAQGEQSTNEAISNEPIKYSTSGAGKWKGAYSTSGEDYFKAPRIQPLIVVISLYSFLIYFCILREENDLDDWVRELETTVPIQTEMAQLRVEIEAGKKKGMDVTWKESRLETLSNRVKIIQNK